MSLQTLIEKSKVFQFSEQEELLSESGRSEFITKFPLKRIKSLTIEEYAIGTDKNSFAYWLEFKKILFGIGGGNASKHGIYKGSDGNYYGGTGHNKILLQGKELEDQFNKIKMGIISALNYVEQDQIHSIKNIDVPIWNMVLQKILMIYFPEKFLSIGASDALIALANDIGLKNIDLTSQNLIEINHGCRKFLSNVLEFKDWNYIKLSSLIWDNYRKGQKIKDQNRDVSGFSNINKYWLYSPGENARKWDELYTSKEIAIGWDELGDLSKYSGKEEIEKRLLDSSENGQRRFNDALACFEFVSIIEPGDIIIAKKGKQEYIGWGIVESQYYYDDMQKEYKSRRKVNWKANGKWFDEVGDIVTKTLTDITKYPEYVSRLTNLLGIGKAESKKNLKKPKLPLNTILFGPPGTGKTFNSIDKAVEIVMGEVTDNHEKQKRIFDELRKQGQIEFLTFHQNYSYEDFVVGIKPDISSGTLRFVMREGIFKILVDKAKQNWIAATNKKEKQIDFNLVFNKFFSKLIDEEVSDIEIQMNNKNYKFKITSIDFENGRIKFTKQSGGTGHDLLISNIKAIYEGSYDYRIEGLGAYYYPLVEKLREFANTLQPESKADVELKNYVLVIDEINRANISKVFGELITLLEDDKRLGEPNELKITLPNGEKEFGIPPNLFIIGTMNTADKSIALIDIALRRRFEFIGYYPTAETINKLQAEGKLSAEKSDLLKRLNKAVYEKRNRSADYLIGHAYFINNNSIEEILLTKIIPLLMEYFSGKSAIVSEVFSETAFDVYFDEFNYSWIVKRK